MFWELFLKKGPDKLELKGFKFDPAAAKQLFRIGAPAMANTFILNLGFFLINTEVEKYGPVVLNGQGTRRTRERPRNPWFMAHL